MTKFFEKLLLFIVRNGRQTKVESWYEDEGRAPIV